MDLSLIMVLVLCRLPPREADRMTDGFLETRLAPVVHSSHTLHVWMKAVKLLCCRGAIPTVFYFGTKT